MAFWLNLNRTNPYNTRVLVNMDNATFITTKDDATEICFIGEGDSIFVKETYNQIHRFIAHEMDPK